MKQKYLTKIATASGLIEWLYLIGSPIYVLKSMKKGVFLFEWILLVTKINTVLNKPSVTIHITIYKNWVIIRVQRIPSWKQPIGYFLN